MITESCREAAFSKGFFYVKRKGLGPVHVHTVNSYFIVEEWFLMIGQVRKSVQTK